jgi:nucleotide-binding universal stress UspA family protein
MSSLRRIIVGVDGSNESKQALQFAVDEGGQHEIPVLAVHASTSPAPPTAPALTAPADYAELFSDVQDGAERRARGARR